MYRINGSTMSKPSLSELLSQYSQCMMFLILILLIYQPRVFPVYHTVMHQNISLFLPTELLTQIPILRFTNTLTGSRSSHKPLYIFMVGVKSTTEGNTCVLSLVTRIAVYIFILDLGMTFYSIRAVPPLIWVFSKWLHDRTLYAPEFLVKPVYVTCKTHKWT